ncbi:hypothetical protein HDU81_005513 [Chytriomyces hyalinus]|nr:hypothetical protein HDU81_005513 [Chytriomyces hyalinus]
MSSRRSSVADGASIHANSSGVNSNSNTNAGSSKISTAAAAGGGGVSGKPQRRGSVASSPVAASPLGLGTASINTTIKGIPFAQPLPHVRRAVRGSGSAHAARLASSLDVKYSDPASQTNMPHAAGSIGINLNNYKPSSANNFAQLHSAANNSSTLAVPSNRLNSNSNYGSSLPAMPFLSMSAMTNMSSMQEDPSLIFPQSFGAFGTSSLSLEADSGSTSIANQSPQLPRRPSDPDFAPLLFAFDDLNVLSPPPSVISEFPAPTSMAVPLPQQRRLSNLSLLMGMNGFFPKNSNTFPTMDEDFSQYLNVDDDMSTANPSANSNAMLTDQIDTHLLFPESVAAFSMNPSSASANYNPAGNTMYSSSAPTPRMFSEDVGGYYNQSNMASSLSSSVFSTLLLEAMERNEERPFSPPLDLGEEKIGSESPYSVSNPKAPIPSFQFSNQLDASITSSAGGTNGTDDYEDYEDDSDMDAFFPRASGVHAQPLEEASENGDLEEEEEEEDEEDDDGEEEEVFSKRKGGQSGSMVKQPISKFVDAQQKSGLSPVGRTPLFQEASGMTATFPVVIKKEARSQSVSHGGESSSRPINYNTTQNPALRSSLPHPQRINPSSASSIPLHQNPLLQHLATNSNNSHNAVQPTGGSSASPIPSSPSNTTTSTEYEDNDSSFDSSSPQTPTMDDEWVPNAAQTHGAGATSLHPKDAAASQNQNNSVKVGKSATNPAPNVSSSSSSSSSGRSNANQADSPVLPKASHGSLGALGTSISGGGVGGSGSGGRPRDYQCSVCRKWFLRRQDLRRHEVTHSKVKAFQCPLGCGTTFGRSDALSRHPSKLYILDQMTAAVGVYSFQDMKPEQALYTMDAGHTSDRFDSNGSGGHANVSMGGEVFKAEPQTETGSNASKNLMDRPELQQPQLQVEHSQGFMLLHDAFQLSETGTSNMGYHAPLSPPLARNAAAVLAQMNMHPRNHPQNHVDHPNYLHQDGINQHTLQYYNLYQASPPSSAQISPAIHHPTFSQHNNPTSQHPLLAQQNYVPSPPEQIPRPVLDSSYPLQYAKKELPAKIHSQKLPFSRDNLDQDVSKHEETTHTVDANEAKESDELVSTSAEGSSDSKPGKQSSAKRLTNGKSSGIGSDRRPRDHRCGVCHKGFLRKQDLSRHEVTHSSVKAFSCPMGCGTTFGRSDAMAR